MSEAELNLSGVAQDEGLLASIIRPSSLTAERLTVIGLLAVLFLGVYFRFVGQNWDHNQHLHPDERFLTMVGSGIQPVPNLGEYFNTETSTLNPHNKGFSFFVYGTLPIFIVRYTAAVLDQVCSGGILEGVCAFATYSDYEHIFLVGRTLSALSDLIAIVVLFFIGRRLYDRRVGLIAAFLGAVSVLPIQLSHYYTVDVMATAFVVATFYFAVRIAQEGRWWDYVLCGLLFGMALAGRVNVLVMAPIIAVAALINVFRVVPRLQEELREVRDIILLRFSNITVIATQESGGSVRDMFLWRTAILLGLCMVLAAVVFRIGQPYAFEGPGFFDVKPNEKWVANMTEIQRTLTGEIEPPPNFQWANRIVFLDAWKNVVLWGLGLPLGLMAWGAWLWAGVRSARSLLGKEWADGEWQRHLMAILWIGGYFLVAGRLYAHGMRYLLPIYPFLGLMAAWGLVRLWDMARERRMTNDERRRAFVIRLSSFVPSPRLAALTMVGVLGLTFLWAFAFTRIYTRPVSREAASVWIYENVPSVASLLLDTPEGPRQYQMTIGTQVSLSHIAHHTAQFRLDYPATLKTLRYNYLATTTSVPTTIRVVLASDSGGTQIIDEATVRAVMTPGADPRGRAYDFNFPTQPVLAADTTYYALTYVTEGGPVTASTSNIAAETSWDDWLPLRMLGRDPYSMMYNGINLELYSEEDPPRREALWQMLDQADYIVMSSQRVIWSVTRIPQRWPMTIGYYEKLFSGELGFDLAGVFHSLPNLGPLIISDISAELAWEKPPVIGPYVSDWAAEEAFSVYDHPPVWVFKKNPERYSSESVRAFLFSFDPANTVKITGPDASRAPLSRKLLQILYSHDGYKLVQLWRSNAASASSQLMLDAAARERNEAGGTWSNMFSWESLLVRFEPLAIAVWWLTVLALGWLAFPIAFIAMRGLADRGYIFSKALALLLLAYSAWLAGSFRLLPFTRSTLLLLVMLLGAIAAVIVRSRREEIVGFVRERRQHILLVEGLFLAFFLFFVFVRLGNPELWHPSFGGEKPMNFAYFNAILKTTWFPPYDPWFAGGYINYYYFGYVIAAVVTKLLGLVPAYAYNLILPMLFSLTAMGGFGVAYYLVDGRRRTEDRRPMTDNRSSPSALGPQSSVLRHPPYLAGMMAALLLAVLGNLGEIHLIIEKGYMALAPADSAPCTFKSTIPGLESLVCNTLPTVNRTVAGLGRVLEGERLPIATNWWYWNATRVIPPAQGEAGPITEFPYFTFLYADMHAHMFAMSLATLSFALGLAWIQGRRRPWPGRTAGAFAPMEDGEQRTEALRPPSADGIEAQGVAPPPDAEGTLSTDPGRPWALTAAEAEATPATEPVEPGSGAPELSAPASVYAASPAAEDTAEGAPRPGEELAAQEMPALERAARLWATLRGRLNGIWPSALTIGLLALVAGVMWPTNAWDYYTYLALAMAAVFLGEIEHDGRLTVGAIGRSIGLALLVAVLSYVFFLPYRQALSSGSIEVEPWRGSKTPVWAYLILYGVFLFILVSWMAHETVDWLRGLRLKDVMDWLRAWWGPLGAAILALVVMLLLVRETSFWSEVEQQYPIMVTSLVLPLALFAALLALRPRIEAERRVVSGLVAVALALTFVYEVVVPKGLDIGRMNTVFKLAMQAWIMLAVTSGVALLWLWKSSRSWAPWLRRTWGIAAGVLLFFAALYPIQATRAKWDDRFAPRDIPPTLNGMAYMQGAKYDEGTGPFDLRGDYDAIVWMQKNIPGSPVIVEASSGYPGPNVPLYHFGNRVANNTGLPAVMGWDWHQKQQRSLTKGGTPGQWIDQRQQEVHDFYTIYNAQQALDFIKRYRVRYVYVGPEEHAIYGPAGLAKFDQMPELQLVYENPQVKIYQVMLPAE